MHFSPRAVAMLTALFALLFSANLGVAAAATRPSAATSAGKQTPAARAKQLRAEWDIPELKLTREAVDDTTFAPNIKQSAINAVDWFLQRQEALLDEVEKDPAAETKARRTRTQLEADFQQRMAVVYKNPKLMAELTRSLKALDKEMDDLAVSADKMFANLNNVGLTTAQKQQLRPVVEQANASIKTAVARNNARGTRDPAARDEVVKQFRAARAKVKQQLTPEQRAKLAQKNAQEK